MLNSWIEIKTSYKTESMFSPKPYERFNDNIKVELNLSNYATKADRYKWSNSCWYIWFSSKIRFIILKAELDKINVDKYKTGPADLTQKLWKLQRKYLTMINMLFLIILLS